MRRILRLENPIRNYPWGSRRSIAGLLGRAVPSEQPEAELWMGDHPLASSKVEWDGISRPLAELVPQHPLEIVGDATARSLPFLFKILAAERPLSIQAHPDAEAARRGYAREDAAGLPVDAKGRSYRDRNAKPELLYALEPFWLVAGFRPPEEILRLAARFGLDEERLPALDQLGDGGAETLGKLAREWLNLSGVSLAETLEGVLERAGASDEGNDDPQEAGDVAYWLRRLAVTWPGDPGILAPLFLQLRRLERGEVLFTPPGVLHAYLEGFGVELMVNSDNVLRGALTRKHRDIPELLSIVRLEPGGSYRLPSRSVVGGEVFEAPLAGLRLSRLEPSPEGVNLDRGTHPGGAIALCVAGSGTLTAGDDRLLLRRGEACLIPAAVEALRFEGEGEIFCATAD